jgi:cytochrome c553
VRVLLVAGIVGASMLMSVGANAAGDAAAGKAKSAMCAACHGPDGNSPNPLWPNLAGQHAPYMVKQLKAFKSGERKDPVMAPMAMPLSDADMENLAAYFASQKLK